MSRPVLRVDCSGEVVEAHTRKNSKHTVADRTGGVGSMNETFGKYKRVIVEQRHLHKRRLSKKWEAFLKMGHEKMTIMFIPHDEKKIFNFQISKFTISFFVILFGVILTTSSFAFVKNSQVKTEEEQLLQDYREIRDELEEYEDLTKQMSQAMSEMRPDIEDLYEIAQGGDESSNLWSQFQKKQIPESESAKKTSSEDLPSDLRELQKLRNDILCAANTLKTVSSFVDVRSKVISDTPSIIPNSGHITSLFGWRRSPFGFGRDFHPGIDIASTAGAPVYATAPGKVISAGWYGGYGKAVRIAHKYGYETIYGHNSQVVVSTGDVIKKGQLIAYVGSTGLSTGNHCHYEIRLANVPINPYPFMSRMW